MPSKPLEGATQPVTPDGGCEAPSDAQGRVEQASLALRLLTVCVCRSVEGMHAVHCSADWAEDVAVLAAAAGVA